MKTDKEIDILVRNLHKKHLDNYLPKETASLVKSVIRYAYILGSLEEASNKPIPSTLVFIAGLIFLGLIAFISLIAI